MKLVQGILLGIGLTFGLFLGYRQVISPYYALTVPRFVTDTTKKVIAQGDVVDLKNQNLSTIEKIEALNKRLDDLLIFGAIIITLLLAINVSVFVNTDRQVDKYFRDNFETHKNKVTKYLEEVTEMAGKVQTQFDLIQNINETGQAVQPTQTPPQ